MFKKCSVIVAVIMLLLSLSGCIHTIGIKERGLIQAIGIDWENNEFVVTVQIFDAAGTGGPSTFDVTKENDILLQSRGETISDALKNLSQKQGKRMFLGNNKIIVLGDSILKEGYENVIDFFLATNESRSKTLVVAAENKASDIVTAQLKGGIVPANAIELATNNSKNSSYTTNSTMVNLVTPMQIKGLGGCLPIMAINKDVNEEEVLEIIGGVVTDDSKEVVKIDIRQTRGIMWLTSGIKQSLLQINDDKIGPISIVAKNSKCKIKTKIIDGSPVFDIKITTNADIKEVVQDYEISEEVLHDIEIRLAQTIYDEITESIRLIYYENHVDVFNFCRYLKKYQPEYWKSIENKYSDIMESVRFNIEVICEFEKIGYYLQGA